MSVAVDPRDYLVKLGLAKEGRGRFSLAAKEALAKAEKEGVSFRSKSIPTATVTVVDDQGNKTTETREVNPWAHHPDPVRTETHYTFVRKGAKLRVAASEACSACSYSLGWCYCETPTVRHWRDGQVYRMV